MSKRQLTLQPCCHTAKRRRPPPSQLQQLRQHVYLVVDDWESGYSVRKIDIDAMYSDAGADLDDDDEAEPLPDPPVVRFYGRHCRLSHFGAYGTSILAMPVHCDATGAFPIFDTKTLGLTLCPHPGGSSLPSKPLFASVAGELYLTVGSSTIVLDALQPPGNDEDKQWSWIRSPKILVPFNSGDVVSFAVHPNDRLLFVSQAARTFCLDTKCSTWMTLGNWVMPFKGQAYFDDELDAWIGLCCHKGGGGYVCSCDAPPLADYATMSIMPAWKLGKDQLFNADDDRHLGATLLYLGGISDYCLIESRLHKDQQPFRPPDGPRCCVLRVTKFGLKYDKNGELRTTRQTACSYQMTEGHEFNEICSTPVAFWM
ncbi:unnamed protein product [Triticum turgidum subsp. durum]|uniref:Uncharacterized protein n=1 Tax=Triticum turgidum subsp. durum TaxID=4567 RepID=A0A9R0S2X4_TRITD|nr:unnamed protein product [Triticum turgidum subsp. durum]